MVELLIVIGIIILVLAVTVPVINTLSGNRSAAAAQNQIASMLGTARADAMYNRQLGGVGVFFYPDPTTGQTAMAEVMQIPNNLPAGVLPLSVPPLTSTITSPANLSAAEALDMVFSVDLNPSTNSYFANYFRDPVLLSKGISVALPNNYSWLGTPNLNFMDRYVRIGVIMFDTQGNVTSIPYGVFGASTLGQRFLSQTAGPNNNVVSTVALPTAPTPMVPLMSQIGLVIYDHDAYISQVSTPVVSPLSLSQPFDDMDLEYQIALLGSTVLSPPALPPTKFVVKTQEDNWIEQNGVPLLVSPFNGALIKAK